MKPLTLFILLIISLVFILSCSDKMMTEVGNYNSKEVSYDTNYFTDNTRRKFCNYSPTTHYDTNYSTIDTRGYWENGEIITRFDCPDSRFFPPFNIKSWNKIPVVNGRFPTYKETLNGTSIHTYAGKKNLDVKVYNMTLPKLAYCVNRPHKLVLDSVNRKITETPELVVVVQIVQTAYDTIVGYRYLTGGVGGSLFRDFHFLTDEEVKKAAW